MAIVKGKHLLPLVSKSSIPNYSTEKYFEGNDRLFTCTLYTIIHFISLIRSPAGHRSIFGDIVTIFLPFTLTSVPLRCWNVQIVNCLPISFSVYRTLLLHLQFPRMLSWRGLTKERPFNTISNALNRKNLFRWTNYFTDSVVNLSSEKWFGSSGRILSVLTGFSSSVLSQDPSLTSIEEYWDEKLHYSQFGEDWNVLGILYWLQPYKRNCCLGNSKQHLRI